MNETYIVDPDGDLFLLLVYSPGKPFAPWDHNGDNSLSSSDPSSGHAEFEAKVLSKHLALASLYFNAMLTGPWFEAENCVDGSRHIKLEQEEGFDPEALRILLDIIYGKTRGLRGLSNSRFWQKSQFWQTISNVMSLWRSLSRFGSRNSVIRFQFYCTETLFSGSS